MIINSHTYTCNLLQHHNDIVIAIHHYHDNLHNYHNFMISLPYRNDIIVTTSQSVTTLLLNAIPIDYAI